MYSVCDKKFVNKKRMLDKTELMDIDGFLMNSKNKMFKINDCNIKNLKISSKDLANPLVANKVFKKYEKLIEYLAELLVDDDDTGNSMREALNQIEKFRLEIKNKYRKFLKQKEIEKMSKQLSLLKKEANNRLIQIHNSYIEYMNESKRSK